MKPIWSIALLVALLASCSSDELTQIVIVVDSQMSVPSRLDAIRVEMTAGGNTDIAEGALDGPDAQSLPRFVNMVWGGGSLGPVTVRAVGLLDGGEVVSREARVSFIEGRDVMLRLELLRECVGVTCGAEETCARGGCRPVQVAPSELEDWNGTPTPPDGGMECPMVPERCNGADDDCDGRVDEDFDLVGDPLNCGACGSACPVAGGTPACVMGVCQIECEVGRGNCDSDAFNGCEADLTSPAACGSCTNVCSVPNAMASCSMGVCGVGGCDAGFGDCDVDAANGCEAPTTTLTDCGSCGAACAVANGTPTCVTGMCAVESCNAGFGDCDTDATNGCENPLDSLMHCGGCGVLCEVANGTETCATDACAIDTCDVGFDDCNATHADGCETPLDTLTDCGACGTACALANATASCATQACVVSSCDTGFADCNLTDPDGCEIDVRRDDANCGMCGMTCAGATACFDSTCRELTHVIETAGGAAFGCGLRVSGAVVCWGDNGEGQLGDGTTSSRDTPAPVTGLTDAIAIATGGEHACAVRAGGGVRCWGRNRDGQLGDGTTSRRTVPVDVIGITDAVAVAAGADHTCVARATGSVMCWGRNRNGQLGDGTTTRRTSPVMVVGLADIAAIGAGEQHGCALRAGGTVFCWGENGQGQLGDGSTADRRIATAVVGLIDATDLGVGSIHSCVVHAAGTVSCWGDGGDGRLGTAGGDRTTPTPVAGVSGATHVAGGEAHTCARTGGGTVWCWGSDSQGQLGNGMAGGGATPALVSGLTDAAEVETGTVHSCAARTGGGVDCWGSNADGQLGRAGASSQVPVSATGLP